jgi:hypothetical protein
VSPAAGSAKSFETDAELAQTIRPDGTTIILEVPTIAATSEDVAEIADAIRLFDHELSLGIDVDIELVIATGIEEIACGGDLILQV